MHRPQALHAARRRAPHRREAERQTAPRSVRVEAYRRARAPLVVRRLLMRRQPARVRRHRKPGGWVGVGNAAARLDARPGVVSRNFSAGAGPFVPHYSGHGFQWTGINPVRSRGFSFPSRPFGSRRLPWRRVRCRVVADGGLPSGKLRRPGFLLSRGGARTPPAPRRIEMSVPRLLLRAALRRRPRVDHLARPVAVTRLAPAGPVAAQPASAGRMVRAGRNACLTPRLRANIGLVGQGHVPAYLQPPTARRYARARPPFSQGQQQRGNRPAGRQRQRRMAAAKPLPGRKTATAPVGLSRLLSRSPSI